MRPGGAAAAAPWWAALAGAALTVWLFWPGYLSFDSAYQWWLVRRDGYDPTLPATLGWAWRATDALLPGPAGLFVAQVGLVWSALALLAAQLPWTRFGRALVVLGIGLWPALFALLPHLWKDVWFLAGLLWTVALLARERHRPSLGLRILAWSLLIAAASFRFNAAAALPPLVLYLAWREFETRARDPGRFAWKPLLLALPASLALPAIAHLPQRLAGVADQPVWPTVALWDLAAVSLAERDWVLPASWREPELELDELGAAFSPYSNVPMFETGKLRLNPYHALSAADFDTLRGTWLRLPLDHPGAYWRHRGRVAAMLFGFDRDARPLRQVLMPGWVEFADNPPIAVPARPAREALQRGFDALAGGTLFTGWPYLLLGLAVLVIAARRRVWLAAAVAGSGLLMAAPLPLIAPSAEFRFLLWSVAASLVATLLLWLEPPSLAERPHAPPRPLG